MDLTIGSRKSHSRSGCRNGATKPPLAASTCIGTFQPVSSLRAVRASAISLIGSYSPVNVVPRIATTPIVFSSTCGRTVSGVMVDRSRVIGTYLASTSQYRQNFSQTTCTLLPSTRLGRSVGRPGGAGRAPPPAPQSRKNFPQAPRLFAPRPGLGGGGGRPGGAPGAPPAPFERGPRQHDRLARPDRRDADSGLVRLRVEEIGDD